MPIEANTVEAPEVVVNADECRAFVGEVELALTRYEFRILATLAEHPGWVFSPEQLAVAIEPHGDASPSAVNVHIAHLRAKLAASGVRSRIVTVRGMGWRMRRSSPEIQNRRGPADPPFVGREQETQLLTAVFDAGPGFGLLTGAAGMGKTTLVERVLAARAPRFEVVRVVCDGNGSGDYWLWRQWLGEIERRTGTHIAEEPDGHLVTALLTGGLPHRQAATAGGDRMLAYDAVRRYLETALIGRSRPVVVFIDDLQWADEASLAVLAHILRRIATLPCCIVAACREPDASRRSTLRPVVSFAAERSGGSLIGLTALTQAEVHTCVSATLGTVDDALVLKLYALSSGNPLRLRQCMRVVRDSGMEPADIDRLVAASVSSFVADELRRLPQDTQVLVRMAAVTGVEFEPRLAAEAAGCGDRADGFDAARDAGLLVSAPGGRLRFQHALTRDAVLQTLSKEELESCHAALVHVVRRRSPADARRVFVLAHHAARAGAAHAPEAIGYLVAAARHSAASFAFEDAIAHLSAALGLLDHAGMETVRENRVISAVLERLGGARAALADHRATIVDYEQAIAVRPACDALSRARLFTRLGRTWGLERNAAESERAFRLALVALDSVAARDQAWWSGWIEVCLARLEAALSMDVPSPPVSNLTEAVQSYGSPAQRAKYHCFVAMSLAAGERWCVPDAAVEQQSHAVAEAQLAQSYYLEAYMQCVLGSFLLWRGELDRAESHLMQALAMSRRCADGLGEAAALMHLSIVTRLRRDVRLTEMYTNALAEATAEQARLPEFTSAVDAQRGWIALRRGEPRRCAELCEAALAVWQREPASSQSVWMMAWPALSCALHEGRVRQALEFAVLITRPGQQALQGDLDRRLAEAISMHERGDEQAAGELLVGLDEEARSYGYA